nr:MarR family transcriptional regulator [Anaerolineae bacterium]
MNEQLLELIETYIRSNGYPPSIRDLGGILHLLPGSVAYRLGKLEQAGLIRRTPNVARSVQITHEGMALLDAVRGL